MGLVDRAFFISHLKNHAKNLEMYGSFLTMIIP